MATLYFMLAIYMASQGETTYATLFFMLFIMNAIGDRKEDY